MLANYTPKLGTVPGTPQKGEPFFHELTVLWTLILFLWPCFISSRKQGKEWRTQHRFYSGDSQKICLPQKAKILTVVHPSACCHCLIPLLSRSSDCYASLLLYQCFFQSFGFPPEHSHPCPTFSNSPASSKHHQLSPKISSRFIPSQ